MFTGIIEEIGTVRRIQKGHRSIRLEIIAKLVLENTKIGDSIGVNGVCLTVAVMHNGSFEADVMPETMCRSSLSGLQVGSSVNLERAMAADGRFGGHFVSGHIDGVGKILQIKKDENAIWYTIGAEKSLLRYIVEKGSIAVDGISLTVAKVHETQFAFSAIPHTVAVTVLKDRQLGDIVNIEVDIIGKYVEKLLLQQTFSQKETERKKELTKQFLQQYGY